MAQRTLADLMTAKQQARLEKLFREVLLETSSEEGGPQRIVENESGLRSVLEEFFKSRAEPYFKLEGKEVRVVVDYSTPISKTYKVTEMEGLKIPTAPRSGKVTRRLQLFSENDNCPSEQVLVRVLRKNGLEHADAWDLRGFVSTNSNVVLRGRCRIGAGATQFPSSQPKWEKHKQRPWMVAAEWYFRHDLQQGRIVDLEPWEFSFSFWSNFLLARRIEDK
ncbi:hypothetical protein A3C67_00430 [Candidatus Nomurabacteria bacterium RIFCSPHIGHO2_02_FULL_42_19]|uniref:Uncharacterized protein n=1 Tax=Candidatus Nomurabacteria bacterium RIFCSPHIGHO2_02_FULL_42_19 TaxID=1801756 RepID=A0A1F6W2P3_9BACT|nr:MAG: hypothetical protein A3C67_00430 [Candidatus Nomurabacteria bacterium RIFCSPHIGHO2_02_FULL_42_19]